MSDEQEKTPKDWENYEDVPEEWRKHWIACGVPEGEFPPPIDDREFFAMLAQAGEAEEEEE